MKSLFLSYLCIVSLLFSFSAERTSMQMQQGENLATPYQNEIAAAQYLDGLKYYEEGNFNDARVAFENASLLYNQEEDYDGEALSKESGARSYLALGECDLALSHSRKSLSHWLTSENILGQGHNYFNIGVAMICSERQDEGLRYLQIAEQKFQDSQAREELAQVKQWQDFIKGTLPIRPHLPTPRSIPPIVSATPIVPPVIDEFAMSPANALMMYGTFLVTNGYASASLVPFQQVIQMVENGDADADLDLEVNARLGQGMAYMMLSDYEESLRQYQSALDISQKRNDYCNVSIIMNQIGSLYNEIGAAQQALEYFRGSVQSLPKDGCIDGRMLVLNRFGLFAVERGEHEIALQSFQQVQDLIKENGGDKTNEIHLLINIGSVYRSMGDYSKALEIHQQALDIAIEIDNPTVIGSAADNVGTDYDAKDDPHSANMYYTMSLAAWEAIGAWDKEITMAGKVARKYENEFPDMALTYYQKAISLEEDIRNRTHVESLQTYLGSDAIDVYHGAAKILIEEGHPEQAFDLIERGRARTFLNLIGNNRINPQASEDISLIQKEKQLKDELEKLQVELEFRTNLSAMLTSPEEIQQAQNQLADKRREYESLLTQLQLSNPAYADLITINPLTLDKTQEFLLRNDPDTTLLSYSVGEEQIIIFIVSANFFDAKAIPVSKHLLLQQIQALREQMKAQVILKDAWQTPTRQLYDWLIAPVESLLPVAVENKPAKLIIIPHGELHYLPFALLNNSKKLLVENYVLTYAPSASSLQFIYSNRHTDSKTLLAFANPNVPGAPYLTHAVEEAKAVAKLFNAQPFIGTEASESQFKSYAGDYGVLHLAAHSEYNPSFPLFSAILLAPTATEDGRLQTVEIFNLDLNKTDLVVLSACETHISPTSNGDEMIGLERAFIRAGSPSLLTTLWPVDDAATAIIMTDFYNYLQEGKTKAEALRLAQLKMRSISADPYTWAGYVLVGDAGIANAYKPINVPRNERRLLITGVAIAFLVGFFFLLQGIINKRLILNWGNLFIVFLAAAT